jgi:hypothetical protein
VQVERVRELLLGHSRPRRPTSSTKRPFRRTRMGL